MVHLCYSYSAFCFVGADFFDFKYTEQEEVLKKYRAILGKWAEIKFKAYYAGKQICLVLAVFFFTFFPYMHPWGNPKTITKLSDTSLLVGLGITVNMIGYRMDKTISDAINNMTIKQMFDSYKRK